MIQMTRVRALNALGKAQRLHDQDICTYSSRCRCTDQGGHGSIDGTGRVLCEPHYDPCIWGQCFIPTTLRSSGQANKTLDVQSYGARPVTSPRPRSIYSPACIQCDFLIGVASLLIVLVDGYFKAMKTESETDTPTLLACCTPLQLHTTSRTYFCLRTDCPDMYAICSEMWSIQGHYTNQSCNQSCTR